MDSCDAFQSLVLDRVTRAGCRELGRGTFGMVHTVKYCQMMCAAKEFHAIPVKGVKMRGAVKSFATMCHQWSELRHPSIVQFLGVYYPSAAAGSQLQLPAVVMEMMVDSLTLLVKRYDKIPICIKFSIVHGVSLGLCYLHNHDPPIVHHNLTPNNILLTAHYVAKITDLGVYKMIKAEGREITEVPGMADFMPPEILANSLECSPSVDVFSFAGIILHTFNQQWPRPCEQVQFDSAKKEKVILSEVERRQHYLDEMQQDGEVLKTLVEECLYDEPAVRPTITAVCERIQVSKNVYVKEFSQNNVITLHQQKEEMKKNNIQKEQQVSKDDERNDQLKHEVDQLKFENDTLKADIDLLKSENQHLKQQMVSICTCT